MTAAKRLTFADNFSPDERISLAQKRTEKLVGLMRISFQINANNGVLLRSNKLLAQIPESYAMIAFNEFARSLLYYELFRLAVFWDPAAKDRISIPTVIYLVDDASVNDSLWRRNFRMKKVIELSKKIANSPRLNAILTARNQLFAHSLDQSTIREKFDASKLRTGHEYWLLLRTAILVNSLSLALNDVEFDWKQAWEFADENAHYLWSNCILNVIK